MEVDLRIAQGILAVHLIVISFNLFGLAVIPLGAWRNWSWVRVFWWRALHLFTLSIVAIQAMLGRDCFLTTWQSQMQEAAGRAGYRQPLIQTWLNHLLFWHLPLAFFTAVYILVWIYVLVLWWKVPPGRGQIPDAVASGKKNNNGESDSEIKP
jgi:hypothetical protein